MSDAAETWKILKTEIRIGFGNMGVVAALVRSRCRGMLVTGDTWTLAGGVQRAGGPSSLRPLTGPRSSAGSRSGECRESPTDEVVSREGFFNDVRGGF